MHPWLLICLAAEEKREAVAEGCRSWGVLGFDPYSMLQLRRQLAHMRNQIELVQGTKEGTLIRDPSGRGCSDDKRYVQWFCMASRVRSPSLSVSQIMLPLTVVLNFT